MEKDFGKQIGVIVEGKGLNGDFWIKELTKGGRRAKRMEGWIQIHESQDEMKQRIARFGKN